VAAQAARFERDSARGAHIYQVYVRPYPGWWKRWHGRVITRDENDLRRFWPWRYHRSREALVRTLSADVHRDVGASRDGVAVEILEVTTSLS
jgi:hypothetical protein